MATVNELLLLIDELYPSATSNTTKIRYMNMAQNSLSGEFGLVATDTSLVTKAYDDEYTLPTGIEDISQIETFEIASKAPETDSIMTSGNMKVGAYTITEQPNVPCRVSFTHVSVGATDTLGTIVLVGTSGGVATTETITPVADTTVYSTKYYSAITSITGASWVISAGNDTISIGNKLDRYDTERYPIGYKDDKPFGAKCIYQAYSSTGVKSLIIYPSPILAGIPITIRYKKPLTDLSATSLTSSPEFDSDYHDLLALFACHQICANGASPDTIQANRFAEAYDARLAEYWGTATIQKIIAPKKRKDNRQWHGGR